MSQRETVNKTLVLMLLTFRDVANVTDNNQYSSLQLKRLTKRFSNYLETESTTKCV